MDKKRYPVLYKIFKDIVCVTISDNSDELLSKDLADEN